MFHFGTCSRAGDAFLLYNPFVELLDRKNDAEFLDVLKREGVGKGTKYIVIRIPDSGGCCRCAGCGVCAFQEEVLPSA